MPLRFTLAALPGLIALALALLAVPASASVVVAPAATAPPLTGAEMKSARPLDPPAANQLSPDSGTGTVPWLDPTAKPSSMPRQSRRYTTRPAGARPLNGEGDSPFSAHGRIFFQKVGSSNYYSCSGTVVRSRKRNLIFTAGHCVYDLETAAFTESVIFVPAYRDGQAPFGQFPATFSLTTSGWIGGSGTGHDIGAITVEEPVQDLVGGRPVDFEFSPGSSARFSIFGYPAFPTPTYDGESPIVCQAAYVPGIQTGSRPSFAASPCDMQQGSSGGGWITPAGYLVSVVSHGYCDTSPETCGIIFGPRLGNAGIRIYQRAGGSEPPRLGIRRGPRGRIAARRAGVSFSVDASTQVRLECRIAGPGFYRRAKRGFRPCGRNPSFNGLRPGRYMLRARLIDQLGRRAQVRRAFTVIG